MPTLIFLATVSSLILIAHVW